MSEKKDMGQTPYDLNKNAWYIIVGDPDYPMFSPGCDSLQITDVQLLQLQGDEVGNDSIHEKCQVAVLPSKLAEKSTFAKFLARNAYSTYI